jgi:hypothetical protein
MFRDMETQFMRPGVLLDASVLATRLEQTIAEDRKRELYCENAWV